MIGLVILLGTICLSAIVLTTFDLLTRRPARRK